MQITKVPLLNTPVLNGLVKAYLTQNEDLRSFYNFLPEIDAFEQAISLRKQFPVNREKLQRVLQQQHKDFLELYPEVNQSVQLIIHEQSFTITTGHQICLATGPLYFVYKIASVIHTCKQLKTIHPNFNFIPVLWMATEDHDFEEINHLHLFQKKITWQTQEQGATGRIKTQGIQTFLTELNEILGSSVYDLPLFEKLEKAYVENKNLSEATRALVLHLFGSSGLLVIDADNRELKEEFIPLIKNDILQQVSYKEVSQSIRSLVSKNLIKEEKVQVKPRLINFFYLDHQMRKRIVFENETYRVLDSNLQFTPEQLSEAIEQNPEKFSPNVIMRPLYQEHILPNLAYIGGGGELSYWLEFKSLFDAHKVFFPMLVLRNSFLWIDKKQEAKLMENKIAPSEIFEPFDFLIQKVLQQTSYSEIDCANEKQQVEHLFNHIKEQAISVEKTLGNSVEAEKQKTLKSIETIAHKINKASKQRHETQIGQIKKVKEQLFPEGNLQERYDNILWLQQKFGVSVIDTINSLANPFLKEFTIITA